MSDLAPARHKNVIFAIAALFSFWGVLGALDVAKQPHTGYTTESRKVTEIEDDSPAAMAGVQIGDSLLSIAGVSLDDSDGLGTLIRAEVGGTRAIVVDRGGTEASLDLTYGPQPTSAFVNGYLVILLGAIFVALGLWAYLKAPNAGTRLLAVLGCCAGPLFLGGPYLGTGALADVAAAVIVSGIVMGFATLLDFVIRSGKADGYQASARAPGWLYWPPVAIAVVASSLVILQPDLEGALGTAFQVVLGAFFLTYFGGSLVMVARNYLKADAGLRTSRALGLMLAGAVIGLAPVTLVFLLSLLPGDVTLPGVQYMVFGIAAVPITFALAAVKGGGVSVGTADLESAPDD